MSEEQLKAFIEKVQGDTSLQEQLKAEGADVLAIAKVAGFAITKEDLNTHRQTLSDNELEGMAGGGATTCPDCQTAPTLPESARCVCPKLTPKKLC